MEHQFGYSACDSGGPVRPGDALHASAAPAASSASVQCDDHGHFPPAVYDQLREVARRMMQHERLGHTLQATAVVHEAWMRLAASGIDLAALAGRPQATGEPIDHVEPDHQVWLPLACRIIRHVIIDHARHKRRLKRGGDRRQISLIERYTSDDAPPRLGSAGGSPSVSHVPSCDTTSSAGAAVEAEAAPSAVSPLDLLALDEALHELERIGPRQSRVVEMKFFGRMTTREIARVLGVGTRTVEEDWTSARAFLTRRLASV